ncbi:MAG: hypothetical protein LUO91_00810, partial [Methanomicrobiales archaeon]|nr:hypothetical protein [Methanomicrobiales archaeon]
MGIGVGVMGGPGGEVRHPEMITAAMQMRQNPASAVFRLIQLPVILYMIPCGRESYLWFYLTAKIFGGMERGGLPFRIQE